MDNDLTDQSKSSFPLFNFEALKNSTDRGLSSGLMSPSIFTKFTEDRFHKKINLEGNLEIMKKKRGRKPQPKNKKDINDPSITLKEIIDDHHSGVPTQDEVNKKPARRPRIKGPKDKEAITNGEEQNKVQSLELSYPSGLQNELATIGDQNPLAPRLILKDGQLVLADSIVPTENRNKKLTIVQNKKPPIVTSMSFRQRNHTEKWTAEETRKFLKAIEIFGSDFSMIAKLFPKRNRGQIKNKFRKEEKENPNEIDQAFKKHELSNKRTLKNRIKNFNLMLEKDHRPLSRTNSGENPDQTDLNRHFSNSSVDSMDMKIMDELQDIFLNEILQSKHLALPPTSTTNLIPSNQSIKQIGHENKQNGHENNESKPKDMIEERAEDQDMKPKSNNLLMNILHK